MIITDCPNCGTRLEFGESETDYTLMNVPFDVIAETLGQRCICDCGKQITFAVVERRMFIPMLEAR